MFSNDIMLWFSVCRTFVGFWYESKMNIINSVLPFLVLDGFDDFCCFLIIKDLPKLDSGGTFCCFLCWKIINCQINFFNR